MTCAALRVTGVFTSSSDKYHAFIPGAITPPLFFVFL